MSFNITSTIPPASAECISFCNEHIANQQINITIDGLFIVFFAAVLLLTNFIITKFEKQIDFNYDDRKIILKVNSLLPEIALYVLIIFFLWYKFI